MIYIFYTHKIVVGLTPTALRYRSFIRYTPFSPHMRRVKYGIFKNIQKILKIKLKSFSWCQKMQNSSLYTNIQNDLQ